MRLTASNIVRAIESLDRAVHYDYVNRASSTKVVIESIQNPEGPIHIKRYDPRKEQSVRTAGTVPISTQMIWRVAHAFSPGRPINFDRVLGASYNTRSALEALLAHTPQFYWCYPGRIEDSGGGAEIRRGHKHLVWLPTSPHAMGVMAEHQTDFCISEIPVTEAVYDAVMPPSADAHPDLNDDSLRRHAQIQVALVMIGLCLDYSVWIASDDQSIVYRGERITSRTGVLARLQDVRLLEVYSQAVSVASRIDCIWFKNSRLMPAVFEVEQTTGVTSGLGRMKELQLRMPETRTRWVICAPDDYRQLVIRKANEENFASLDAKFMPYSAVEELFSLCERRALRGITDEFIDCFMEATVP